MNDKSAQEKIDGIVEKCRKDSQKKKNEEGQCKKANSEFMNNYSLNLNEYKKKNYRKLYYISWVYQLKVLLEHDEDATWRTIWFQEGDKKVPYLKTEVGYFVSVEVTSKGKTRECLLPVMDKNSTKTLFEPTSIDINNNIQRCLAKCIAMFGYGLYVYAGEDSPRNGCIEEQQKGDVERVQKVEEPYGEVNQDYLIFIEDKLRDETKTREDMKALWKNLYSDNGEGNIQQLSRATRECVVDLFRKYSEKMED